MYIDFQKCQLLATKLLSEQNLTSAKIDVTKLVYDKIISFCSFQEYAIITHTPIKKFYRKEKLLDGLVTGSPKEGIYIVLYNANLSKNRINWTLAHEIGHIYMGHMHNGDTEEIEAHMFAAQLLMPEYTLFMFNQLKGNITIKDIMAMFFVSEEAAKKRMRTFKQKTIHICDPLEKDIWNMLKHDIFIFANVKKSIENPLPYIPPDDSMLMREAEWLYGFL